MEAIVSQLMEKQRLARTGGSVGAVPVAVNGHVSNAPQRQQQQQQQLQTGGGGGGGGGRVGNSRTSANMEPQVHHNHKVGADASSLNDLATGHSLPHSLRRLSNGGPASSFIRLEPRPAPSHSSNIQQRQTVCAKTRKHWLLFFQRNFGFLTFILICFLFFVGNTFPYLGNAGG